MKLINRNLNVLNNLDDLELLYNFKDFPVNQHCTDQKSERDLFADMEWCIGKSNGIIQLKKLIPLKKLYVEQHNSVVGKTWKDHHLEFYKFISKYIGKNILEIGSAHGYLINKIKSKKINTKITIIEPNPNLKNSNGIKVINSFFDDRLKVKKASFDTIVHSHVFEHIYNPRKFINKIDKLLKKDGYHCFSIPRMSVMLDNSYTNCLDFEHTIYFSEIHLDYLLMKNNFKIIEKKYFKENHSIFYCTSKSHENLNVSLPNLYKSNKNVFNNFILFHTKIVKKFNKKINNFSGEVYLFGAHIFAQYLLYFGLNKNKLLGILDNDKLKQNKRLIGTDLNVYSPKILQNKKNVAVILRAAAYNREIINEINKFTNHKIYFWE